MKKAGLFLLFTLCSCLILSACGSNLNSEQREIKESYEKQLETSVQEYDEEIKKAEELEERVSNAESLDDKVQMLLDAGLIYEEEAETATEQRVNDILKDNIEYQKQLKESFIKTYNEQMQKAIDEAK